MRPGWRDHAACAAPEVVAQVRAGELFLLPKDLGSAARKVRRIVARSAAICATCPALEPCRQWALDGDTDPCPSHVLAGMTPTERHRLRREAGTHVPYATLRRPIAHGTNAGYLAHLRRGETPCDACRAAHADYNAGRTGPIARIAQPRPACGTRNGAVSHRRHDEPVCEACRDAERAHWRRRSSAA